MQDKEMQDKEKQAKEVKDKMVVGKEDQVVTVEDDFNVDTAEGDDSVTIACLVKE